MPQKPEKSELLYIFYEIHHKKKQNRELLQQDLTVSSQFFWLEEVGQGRLNTRLEAPASRAGLHHTPQIRAKFEIECLNFSGDIFWS